MVKSGRKDRDSWKAGRKSFWRWLSASTYRRVCGPKSLSGYNTHSRRTGLHILPQAHSVLSSSFIPECHSLTSTLRKRNTIYPATIFWNSTSSEKVSLTIHSFKLPQEESSSVIQCLPSGCVNPWLSMSCLVSWVLKNGLSRLFLPF